MIDDVTFMAMAIDQARDSLEDGGVPVGACLVDADGNVLGLGHNERVQSGDPIAHGEIACLRAAGRRASYEGCTLYTTLSPCDMCRGAILLFKIPRVVVGEAETFAGNLKALRRAKVEVKLLNDSVCKSLMKTFQADFPEVWYEDIGAVESTVK